MAKWRLKIYRFMLTFAEFTRALTLCLRPSGIATRQTVKKSIPQIGPKVVKHIPAEGWGRAFYGHHGY